MQVHNRQTDRWIAGLASSPWFRPGRGTSRDTVMRYVTAPRYHYKSRLNKLVGVFCPNQPNYEYSLSWDLVGTEGHLLLSHFVISNSTMCSMISIFPYFSINSPNKCFISFLSYPPIHFLQVKRIMMGLTLFRCVNLNT